MKVERLPCGSCITCPFALTEESEQGQNYGCLPSPHDISQMHIKHNINWACHYDNNRVCSGFASMFKKSDLFNPLVEGKNFNNNLPLVNYEEWYHKGEEKAIRLAKERWNTND